MVGLDSSSKPVKVNCGLDRGQKDTEDKRRADRGQGNEVQLVVVEDIEGHQELGEESGQKLSDQCGSPSEAGDLGILLLGYLQLQTDW